VKTEVRALDDDGVDVLVDGVGVPDTLLTRRALRREDLDVIAEAARGDQPGADVMVHVRACTGCGEKRGGDSN